MAKRPDALKQADDPSVFADEPAALGDGEGRYASRIASAFALVALMTALIVVIMLAFSWNQSFEKYRRTSMEGMAQSLAERTAVLYAQNGGWQYTTLTPIFEWVPLDGIRVRILDSAQNVRADSRGIGTPEGVQRSGLFSRIEETDPAPRQRVAALIVVNGQEVGSIEVWALGDNALLSENDLAFRSATFFAVAIAAVFAVFLASMAGMIFSERLTRPIEAITRAAAALMGGDLGARTGMKPTDHGGGEIVELGMVFDEMAEAIEKDRLLERRLTSDMAHELRTPLMAIQATVEAMQDGVLPVDEYNLATVSDETGRLSRLVDAILELTRLERGTLAFDMIDLDLGDLVTGSVQMHEALFEMGGLTLRAATAPGLIVHGDPDRLRQVMGNLLSNAVRYTEEGGEAEVLVYCDGANARVDVSDTGIGINEEDLERAFSRFWRADSARARTAGGLGIGLSVTKEIIDRHNGSISAHLRPEGGTTFSVSIPMVDPPAEQCPPPKRVGLRSLTRDAAERVRPRN